jgi:hypothetical protein
MQTGVDDPVDRVARRAGWVKDRKFVLKERHPHAGGAQPALVRVGTLKKRRYPTRRPRAAGRLSAAESPRVTQNDTVAVVPEAASLVLLGTGLIGAGVTSP